MSKLKMCLLVVVFAVFAFTLSCPADSAQDTITIQAYIDGPSELHVKKTGIYWTNGRNAKPGRQDARNEPTYVNDKPWIPHWKKQKDDRGEDKSDTYSVSSRTLEFELELLAVGKKMEDTGIEKRTPIEVRHQGYEYIVKINDPEVGARWYKFVLKHRDAR